RQKKEIFEERKRAAHSKYAFLSGKTFILPRAQYNLPDIKFASPPKRPGLSIFQARFRHHSTLFIRFANTCRDFKEEPIRRHTKAEFQLMMRLNGLLA
ncbi:MAG: hypothetical protein L0229_29175, partial [Blastocatellia bacterium]|nr:hypothetical protein [Blastocatellia bacterium]